MRSTLIRNAYPELSNYGKSWSTAQENLLIQKVDEGKTREELMVIFGRTNGGIRAKLREIACEIVGLGKTIEYAMEKTKLSKSDIQEQLAKRNISPKYKINIKENIVIKEKSEMKEVIDLMKEIRDLLKKFVESVEIT